MPRLAWLTDLHLNFVEDERIHQLATEIRDADPAGLLIGGDLGEAPSWEPYLHQLDDLLELPLYFVLGNHDYYRGSLHEVRRRAREVTDSFERLHWLPACGVISLDSRTALVGHGGWGDARAGRFRQSSVLFNDYFLISELRTAATLLMDADNPWSDPSAILNAGLESVLNDLGDEAAGHFRQVLPLALADHEHVIVLMHVPPFRKACWYRGQNTDDDWAPHLCCIAAGEVLVEMMKLHPQKRMTVLCGHTHGEGRAEILPNLVVHTGRAKYGEPEIQCIMDTDE